ncbi:hypothetical protein RRG08_024537 [Elysia crispata]|uniref:Reverse transcriptase domain-containing protein n=1 Tax=Elysia crispata TaxID=231223 RepID=A0AAE1CTT2_9GAST|nr:hypothetical protein RRG08_024537 [Elysia crispata]
MCEGIIKQATGKSTKIVASLKSKTWDVITDRDKQMGRWVEHYLKLYTRGNSVTQAALDAIKELPVLGEYSELSVVDVSKVIGALACGRAPDEDSIPLDIIKCGNPALWKLHKLLCLCWREGKVAQYMGDVQIITIYTIKRDHGDCNNYRGTSLLSIVSKVFARDVLAERLYTESQYGFRDAR